MGERVMAVLGSGGEDAVRIMMVSKALVWGMYQRKLEELAAAARRAAHRRRAALLARRDAPPPPGAGLHQGLRLVVPAYGLQRPLPRPPLSHLGALLRQARPDLVHIDEEPYNLATWHALNAARGAGAPALFFTWQNIEGTLPLPFELLQHRAVIAPMAPSPATSDAVAIMQGLGFQKPLGLIPQFGFDPHLFQPPRRRTWPGRRPRSPSASWAA